jgi:hypothetical protein
MGDARRSLSEEPPQGFDILLLDAFAGDAIPVHLLTAEAFQLYLRNLTPGGLLVVHITNRYLDLAPQISRIAGDFGLHGVILDHARLQSPVEHWSRVALLCADASALTHPTVMGTAGTTPQPVSSSIRGAAWTDDFANLFSAVAWRRSSTGP